MALYWDKHNKICQWRYVSRCVNQPNNGQRVAGFRGGGGFNPHIALNANHLTLSGESDLTIANPLGGNAITMNKDGIAIESGGTLTLDAADDIKIGSGSDTLVTFTDAAIDAKASTIDLSANNSIKLAVGGGRNFIKNGKFAQGYAEGWIKTGTGTFSAATVSFDGTPALKVDNPAVDGSSTGLYQMVEFPYMGSSENYVLSFQMYVNGLTSYQQAYAGSNLVYLDCRKADLSVTLQANKYLPESFRSLDGTNLSSQLRFPALTATMGIYIYTHGNATTSYFSGIQLEKGTMATDWSPAPSDPASGVRPPTSTSPQTISTYTTGNIQSMPGWREYKGGSGSHQSASVTMTLITTSCGQGTATPSPLRPFSGQNGRLGQGDKIPA